MIGSWAGELGQTQFLPTHYFHYAVDYDGDGHRNRHGYVDPNCNGYTDGNSCAADSNGYGHADPNGDGNQNANSH